MVKINYIFVAVVLIAIISLVESKRGFSVGRSRKKVANPNVRRKSQGPESGVHQPSAPESAPSNPKPIGWNVDNNKPPAGAPPAYPGMGHNAGPPPAYPGMGHNAVPAHGAPPPYSASYVNPPSYASATGNSYSNIGRIPPRGTPVQGYPDTTSFHGIGYGHNAYGGPSHTSGLYTNNGMGMGGFSGLGTYGSGFGYGGRSSPFSFGNILTGLAVWNIARGFNSYNRPQHVYIHDNREKNVDQPTNVPVVNNSTQSSDQVQEQMPAVTPSVCETCSESTIVSTVPSTDVQHNFVTYHPSLLTYAKEMSYQPDSSHYYNDKSGNIAPELGSTPESTTIYEQTTTE